MIRIADQIVADWRLLAWKHKGAFIEQIQVCLLNGMVFVISPSDFFSISDNE